MKSLRIAMVGTRGIPATYGGIERHVEEIGARLAQRGHDVTVYARDSYLEKPLLAHRGVRIRTLATVETKHFEAFLHSGHAAVDGLLRSYDIVHYHALGPGLFSPVSRFGSTAAVVQTIHGRDDQRGKWGAMAQRALRMGTWLSTWVPHRTIVVSRDLEEDYRDNLGRETTVIPNGAPQAVHRPPNEITQRWGLRGNDYILVVGRLVPEKDAGTLIKAFRNVATDCKLVIVGGSSHSGDYVQELELLAAQDPRVILAGYQYDEVLEELFSNARLFAQPSILEGLPLTLLEAAGYALPIIASDIGPHQEVLAGIDDEAVLFRTGDAADLTAKLTQMLERFTGQRAQRLADDVTARYSWDAATEQVLETYHSAIAARRERGVGRRLSASSDGSRSTIPLRVPQQRVGPVSTGSVGLPVSETAELRLPDAQPSAAESTPIKG